MAIDLGPEADARRAQPIVERFLAAVAAGGARVGEADLVRLRAEGAAAARQGRPLAAPIDAYLSTAWVAWDHALRIGADTRSGRARRTWAPRCCVPVTTSPPRSPTASRPRSGRLPPRAGAMRQAILEELLTTSVMDAAATTRLSRRAALVGLDPASTYHVLVVRPEAEGETTAELVEELARRLARDPGASSVPGRGAGPGRRGHRWRGVARWRPVR